MGRKSYPGTLEKRGDSYRLIQYVGGDRHTKTVRGLTRREAEREARDWHRELEEALERREDGLPGDLRVATLLDRYEREELPLRRENTRKSYASTLTLFRRFLQAEGLEELPARRVRKAHVAMFLGYARRAPLSGRLPVSERSIERHRAVLSAVFAFGLVRELVDANPVQKTRPPKITKRTPVILTPDQYDALIEEADDPTVRAYIVLLGETGMRSGSEALWLRWDDVDLAEGWIQVVSGRHDHQTKSGESRFIPMTPRLKAELREHAARCRLRTYGGQRSPWVFHHERSRRHARAGDRITSLRRAFDAAAKRAGLPDDFVQHDLRHRRVTTWMGEGKSPALIQEVAGHSDIKVTMGYSHLAREHLKALVEGETGGGPIRGSEPAASS